MRSLEIVRIDAQMKRILQLRKIGMDSVAAGEEFLVTGVILDYEELISNEANLGLKTVAYDNLGIICNEIGVHNSDLTYLDLAEGYFRKVNVDILRSDTRFGHLFRRGRNIFYIHNIKDREAKNKAVEFDYHSSVNSNLKIAQYFLYKCFTEGILENGISERILRKYVVTHMAHVAAKLNRWTEFQYYMDFIPPEDRNFEYHSIRAITLDAFKLHTHTDKYPSLSLEIINSCKSALVSEGISLMNMNSLNSLLQSNSSELLSIKLKESHTKNAGVEHNAYRKWCLFNHLTLNEHSIYCQCVKAGRDNIKLRTTNNHTHLEWLSSLQIILEHLKADYGLSRSTYYNSLEGVGLPKYSNIYQNQISNGSIDLSLKSRNLITSFKLTYSILDRIAVALIGIYDSVENKPVYFHDFIDHVKNKVDMNKNRYLVALETIASELYHQNPLGTLKEYKTWRDAIEHNYFFLLKDKDNLASTRAKYEFFPRATFAEYSLFERKTLHLLQLCRSAIFTLVFLVRDTACEKNGTKQHDENGM